MKNLNLVSINKVLFKHSPILSFMYCLWLPLCYVELSVTETALPNVVKMLPHFDIFLGSVAKILLIVHLCS